MRIAFDVSPLSHERTGVNNYIRGSLAGLAAAAQRDGHEVVAFAPTSPEGQRVIPEALDGHPRRAAARDALGAHGWRTAWSRLGWPPAERWLGRFDVAPLQRLDVPAAARRPARDDDPRPRAACTSRSG